MPDLLKAVEAKPNEKIPAIRPGDQVSVHVKIKEGERERIQEFKGIVLKVGKSGNSRNFTVRRVASNGIGVERTFLIRSPLVDRVEVERAAKVRRANLTYLRATRGKESHLKQKFEE